MLSGARVVGLARDGDRVVGARVLDAMTGAEHDVPTRVVVNATGVWAGLTEQLAGVENPIRMRPSKGVHIVVPRDRIDASVALITKTPTSVLFVLPWGRSWVIGTTDTTWHHGLSHPSATHADLTYLLGQANEVLTSHLAESDVIGLYAGLRPLVDTEGLAESEISREHTVRRPLPGLVTIAGGKYTTYRVMAEDAVDRCRDDLGDIPGSTTAEVPLIGAAEPEDVLRDARRHPGAQHIDEEHLDRLAHRYGRLLPELLEVVVVDPSLASEVPRRRRGRSASRSSMPPATRERCTSTTCSPGGRGSTSRRATGVWWPRATLRGSWATCWAGTTRPAPARSRATSSAWPPSSRRRQLRTTTRRPRSASASRTRGYPTWRGRARLGGGRPRDRLGALLRREGPGLA